MITPITVSVIIPVYNVTRYLRQAIESVCSQDAPGTEIIVIDDGSQAEAAAEITRICLDYPNIMLINQPNSGQSIARRNGISRARGQYVMFLDADDVLQPGAIQKLVNCLDENPRFIAAYGRKVYVCEEGNPLPETIIRPTAKQAITGNILPRLLEGMPLLSNGSVCIRREVFECVNFAPALKHGEDWVLWCRLAALGEFIFLDDDVLLHVRRHSDNVSGSVFTHPHTLWEMLETVFHDEYFIEQVGQDKLGSYQHMHEQHVHRYLYDGCKERGYYLRAIWHKIDFIVMKIRKKELSYWLWLLRKKAGGFVWRTRKKVGGFIWRVRKKLGLLNLN